MNLTDLEGGEDGVEKDGWMWLDGQKRAAGRGAERKAGLFHLCLIGYTHLTPKHPSPPRGGDGSAGWRCREKNKMS